jgi:F-type H+-transporting ATPase subunit b
VIPDLSVLWVIFFVLLAVAVVNSLLLKPLVRIMHERELAITTARQLADKAAADAAAATAEFEARTNAARAELHQQLEQARKAALATRERLLADTRDEVGQNLKTAVDQLRTETEAARARLDGEAEALAQAITERVLDRKVS